MLDILHVVCSTFNYLAMHNELLHEVVNYLKEAKGASTFEAKTLCRKWLIFLDPSKDIFPSDLFPD